MNEENIHSWRPTAIYLGKVEGRKGLSFVACSIREQPQNHQGLWGRSFGPVFITALWHFMVPLEGSQASPATKTTYVYSLAWVDDDEPSPLLLREKLSALEEVDCFAPLGQDAGQGICWDLAGREDVLLSPSGSTLSLAVVTFWAPLLLGVRSLL